jgi:hypothetical protein
MEAPVLVVLDGLHTRGQVGVRCAQRALLVHLAQQFENGLGLGMHAQ